MEYYEFFEKSILMGVPDYVPEAIIDGDIQEIIDKLQVEENAERLKESGL